MSDTMDIVTGIVAVTGISALANVLSINRGYNLQTCIDLYMLNGERNDYQLVQCLKENFPSRFADAYKRRLESEAKLPESD